MAATMSSVGVLDGSTTRWIIPKSAHRFRKSNNKLKRDEDSRIKTIPL